MKRILAWLAVTALCISFVPVYAQDIVIKLEAETPGAHSDGQYTAYVSSVYYGDYASGGGVAGLNEGGWCSWRIQIETAGVYKLSAVGCTPESGCSISIYADGAAAAQDVPLTSTGSYEPKDGTAADALAWFALTAGEHEIKAAMVSGNYTLDYLLAEYVSPIDVSEIHIEAEDFDNYYDLTEGIDDAPYYIQDMEGDVECSYIDERIVVAMQQEEWLEYAVTVPYSGYYSIALTCISGEDPGTVISASCKNAEVKKVLKPTEWNKPLENKLILPLEAGENRLRITAQTRYNNFDYMTIAFVPELSGSFEKELLAELKAGYENGYFDKYGSYFGIEADTDIVGVINTDDVLSNMGGSYESITAVINRFADMVCEKIQNPDTVFYSADGRRLTKLDGEDFTVYSRSEPEEDIEVIGAVYSNDKLEAVSFGVKEKTSVTLDFCNFHAGAESALRFKLLRWDGIEGMKPYTYTQPTDKVYVAVNGNDAATGSKESPVATIGRAAEIAAELSADTTSDITVNISSGEYFMTEPVTLTNESNHKNGGRIIFRGQDGAVLNGGEKISSWQKHSANIYKAKVNAKDVRQLYAGGVRMVRAKSGLLIPNGLTGNVLTYGLNLPAGIVGEKNAEIVWDMLWTRQRVPVQSIDYAYKFTLKQPYYSYLQNNGGYSGVKPTAATKFYIENALAFLDEPGEFYFDRDSKTIYFYPEAVSQLNDCCVGAAEGLINIAGADSGNRVENITIENLTMRYGTWLEPNEKGLCAIQGDKLLASETDNEFTEGRRTFGQVRINWARGIEIKNNTLEHLGSAAVDFGEGVTESILSGNTINDVSSGAVMVGSWNHSFTSANPKMCGNIKISDNVITDTGCEFAQSPAVALYYAQDVSVSHNTIKNASYSGISMGWGWGADVSECKNNVIEYNLIENVVTELNDGASIYTLGPMRNSRITGNYMIKSSDGGTGLRGGIYTDEGSAYLTISQNVVKQCERWLYARENARLSDIKVYDNYSDTANSEIDLSAVSMGKHTICENGAWPQQAKLIMESAGAR